MITIKSNLKLEEIIELPDISGELTEEHLGQIGNEVIEELKIDEDSQADWMHVADRVLELSKLSHDTKDTPWVKASNVKLPIITNAAIQFASRTVPEIIKNNKVVLASVNGKPTAEKIDRARRVGDHMSYQLLIESDEWRNQTDKLLHHLAIVGTVHRKTYYDPIRRRNVSELLTHDEVVINNNIKTIDTARRISHIIMMHKNELIEQQRIGAFREFDLDKLDTIENDDFDRYEIIEQHRYLDLDGDGYEEPYIVIVHRATQEVLRISARFDEDGITTNTEEEVINIEPVKYFTDYHLIPATDGSYYSFGFGTLLLSYNEATNTILNQLIDAGTLANMQGGFIGSGLRIKDSTLRFRPGEWKRAQTPLGGKIADNIAPIAYKEPSAVLLQLLGLLIETSKDITNLTDVLTGQQQAQNVPATTMLALVEQGMKMFTAIQARLHVAFRKEFTKLYRLNRIFLDDEVYFRYGDDQSFIAQTDYEDQEMDITPVSDPNLSSEAQRFARSQALMALMGTPGINTHEILIRHLDSLGIPDRQMVLPDEPPPPQPSPEMIQMQSEIDERGKRLQLDAMGVMQKSRDLDIKEQKNEIEALKAKAEAIQNVAKAESLEAGKQIDLYKEQIKQFEAEIKLKQLREAANGQSDTTTPGGTGGVGTAPGNQGAPTSPEAPEAGNLGILGGGDPTAGGQG